MEEQMKKKGALVLVVWVMLVAAKAYEEAPNNIETTVISAAVPQPPNSYWEEVRKVFNSACTYLFPPKIDFRAGKPVEDAGGNLNGKGNVKEALSKSFEETKEMVEESAKAAAQTLHQQPDSEL